MEKNLSAGDKREENFRLPFYVFLLTASFICFELNFLRIITGIRMAFGLTSSFFFSGAILGLGFGSMMVVLYRKKIKLSVILPMIPLSMMLSYVLVYLLLKYRVLLYTIGSWKHFLSYSFLFMPLITIPFILSGLAIAKIFSRSAESGRKLLSVWAFDLIGSALGGLLPILLLDLFDPLVISTAPIIFGIFLVGYRFFHKQARPVWHLICLSLTVLLTVFYFVTWDDLNRGFISAISLAGGPGSARFEKASLAGWSPYHRINYKDRGESTYIYYNSAPITYILKEGNKSFFDQKVTWPFRYAKPGGSTLIIGAGGGKEVYFAQELTDSERITAVELDPEVVGLVRGLKDYAPYIHRENTDYFAGEGRHYLKTSEKKYDLIVYALIDSPTTIAAQSIFKPENYIYTVESFRDAYELLMPDGMIAVYALVTNPSDPQEYSRMVMKLYKNMVTATGQPDKTAVFDFTKPEHRRGTGTIHLLYHNSGIDRQRLLSIIPPHTVLTDREDFIAQAKEVEPNYDSNPFIYIREGLPRILGFFLGEIMVFAVLIIGIPIIIAFRRLKSDLVSGNKVKLLYFFCTGFGFMLLEVVLIHKLVVSFGAPHISSSVIITTLLVGMGITSLYMATRKTETVPRRPAAAFGALIIVMFVLPFYLKVLNSFLLDFSLLMRTGITILMLFPVGLILGVPFPSGLNKMRFQSREGVVLAYALDALGSVTGTVSAIILPMLFGYPAVFLIVTFNYIVIAVIFHKWFRQ